MRKFIFIAKSAMRFCSVLILVNLIVLSVVAQTTLPAEVDHSKSKYFPEVGNQGHIGACDWFASVYYQMTYSYNKFYDREADSTNTFSPKFGYSFLNNGGIFPYNIRLTDVYNFVTKHGCATQDIIPYDMVNGTGYTEWCVDDNIWESALKYRIKGFEYFTMNNKAGGAAYSFNKYDAYLNEIKRLLADGEVLVIQSEPFVEGKTAYGKAVNSNAHTGDHVLITGYGGPEHTMAVVGYSDEIWVDINEDGIVQANEKGAIKIMDSFGTDFRKRNNGAFWMLYSTIESSIFEHRVNRMFIKENYKPIMLAKVTINVAKRDKVKFQFGRSSLNNKEGIDTSLIFDPYSLGFNPCTAGVSLIEAGGLSYNGGKTAVDGSFVFDLTDILNENPNEFWYVRISNDDNEPLLLKEFDIYNTATGNVKKAENLPVSVINSEIYHFLKFQ